MERVSATEPDVPAIGLGKSGTKSLANSVGKGAVMICLSRKKRVLSCISIDRLHVIRYGT